MVNTAGHDNGNDNDGYNHSGTQAKRSERPLVYVDCVHMYGQSGSFVVCWGLVVCKDFQTEEIIIYTCQSVHHVIYKCT